MEKKIIDIVIKNPSKEYGLPFSTWSLRVMAGFISKEMKIVDSISHTEVGNILLKHGIKYRQSKITLGPSMDPEYHLKKRGLKNLRYRNDPSSDSVLLYEDEKGPIVAKTYGGASWSSIQSKVSKAQKTKGFLNCVWRIRSYQQPDVDTWLQKEDRKAILGFYQTSGPKIRFQH